ncbi:TetR/AcrR family transcriptional regulator [Nocardiopsis ganjiahuensis]|uniref:TetR/AcrR family transcriptional regulator n=1 Tax=Nocardiopsis ganjiahuensis TaxID=239984 RepID=UPI000687EC6B|nr:TetR/AcrR family transcriptional regulator [Nocardiopsis ganjiahuensis]
MSERTTRSARVAATRETILSAAERLIAEHGVAGVSNRQIGQEAGQGNNTAVTYHFGSKAGLVRAIVRRHTEQIESVRQRMVLAADGSDQVRDWLACMVEPFAHHLAQLGVPSWYGRFSAQVLADPEFREAVSGEALNSPSLVRSGEELRRCLPDLPPEVRRERQDMARHLMVHMVAERERALAEDGQAPRESWQRSASGLVDALTGLWTAPVTAPGPWTPWEAPQPQDA